MRRRPSTPREADSQARALGWRAADARPWTPELVEALLQLDRVTRRPRARAVGGGRGSSRQRRRPRTRDALPRPRRSLARSVAEAVTLLEEAWRGTRSSATRSDEPGAARARHDAQARATEARRSGDDRGRARRIRSLGAATWVERSREELGRISGRTRQDALTAAERRVATLVAEGRTNHEVAAALFLADRTVASHLTRIYAKLGVRSRTELARPRPKVRRSDLSVGAARPSVEPMPSYLVETYLPRGRVQERAAGERRARLGGRRAGRLRVRFERSIHVPEDEICFYVFDAPSGRDAALAARARRARPDPDRRGASGAIKEDTSR